MKGGDGMMGGERERDLVQSRGMGGKDYFMEC